MRLRLAAVLLATTCSCAAAGTSTNAASDPCASLPLLARWERNGLARRTPGNGVHVSLAADIHAPDCGAPDCYGTDIRIELTVVARANGCFIDGALIRTREYVRCGSREDTEGVRTAAAFLVEGTPDLASRALERVTFRSADGRKALVVRPAGAFWFDEVERGHPLQESPMPDEAKRGSCCWATAMSAAQLARP